MATQRTQEEKSAILSHCLKLEREGGDILAYLWSQNYLTPRATWFNYQREWLGRKPYQYTDGKPRKEKKMARKSTISAEIKEAAVKAYLAGGQPCTVLRNAGVKNPSSAWTNIKRALEAKHPEAAEKLKADTEPLELEAGMNYEVNVLPAKPDMSVTLEKTPKITKPLMHSGKTAIGWAGDFGEYHYDRKQGYLDYESNDGEELSMPVEAWRNWLKEIHEVAQLLGVSL